jgi:thiamine kinase-like enzyme
MENHLIEKKLNYSEILNQIKGYNTMNKIEIIEKIIEIINKMLMEIEIKNQKSYLEIIGG